MSTVEKQKADVAKGSQAVADKMANVRKSKGRDPSLPPLTASQRMAKQIVQNAQNACKFIKDDIEQGNMPSGELLQACSTLSASLGKLIGSDS